MFFRRDRYQGKIVSKTTTVGWVWPDMPFCSQTCLDLPGMNFSCSGVGVTAFEMIHFFYVSNKHNIFSSKELVVESKSSLCSH